ncbi:MAG: hypothetical protein ACR2FN_01635 [Chitinophagaceae bacterium]
MQIISEQKKEVWNYFSLQSLFILLLFISAISCKVALVPEYNADLETQISNDAKMTDMLYLEMMDASADKKNYSLYADKYINIETEINSILLKNEARAKAGDIVASVEKLRDYFVKAKEDHKKRDTLSNAEFLIYNEQLKAFWKPILVEEIALSKAK